MLANFGEMVVRELEKERVLEMQKRQNEALSKEKANVLRAMNLISEAIMMCDISRPSWPLVFTNEAWEAETGVTKDGVNTTNFWDVFQVTHLPQCADGAEPYSLYPGMEKNQQK